MKIIFSVDPDALTWQDLDDMEDVQTSGKLKPVRRILARFMVDEAGAPVAELDAMKALGALTLPQVREAVEAFTASLRGTQASAVPPVSSAASSPTSDTAARPRGGAES